MWWKVLLVYFLAGCGLVWSLWRLGRIRHAPRRHEVRRS